MLKLRHESLSGLPIRSRAPFSNCGFSQLSKIETLWKFSNCGFSQLFKICQFRFYLPVKVGECILPVKILHKCHTSLFEWFFKLWQSCDLSKIEKKSLAGHSITVLESSFCTRTKFSILAFPTKRSWANVHKLTQLHIFLSYLETYPCLVSALHAKALYYQETLCRKEDIQKFLSTLVTKRPEVGPDFGLLVNLLTLWNPQVGHLVKCFHVSKSADAKTNSGHKVYSSSFSSSSSSSSSLFSWNISTSPKFTARLKKLSFSSSFMA